MKSWYKIVNDIELKDGSTIKEDRLVFETTDKELSKRVEGFFKSLMDEPQRTCDNCGTPRDKCVYCIEEDKMWTPKTEPQTDDLFTDKYGDVWEWRGNAWYCISGEDEPQTERSSE